MGPPRPGAEVCVATCPERLDQLAVRRLVGEAHQAQGGQEHALKVQLRGEADAGTPGEPLPHAALQMPETADCANEKCPAGAQQSRHLRRGRRAARGSAWSQLRQWRAPSCVLMTGEMRERADRRAPSSNRIHQLCIAPPLRFSVTTGGRRCRRTLPRWTSKRAALASSRPQAGRQRGAPHAAHARLRTYPAALKDRNSAPVVYIFPRYGTTVAIHTTDLSAAWGRIYPLHCFRFDRVRGTFTPRAAL